MIICINSCNGIFLFMNKTLVFHCFYKSKNLRRKRPDCIYLYFDLEWGGYLKTMLTKLCILSLKYTESMYL